MRKVLKEVNKVKCSIKCCFSNCWSFKVVVTNKRRTQKKQNYQKLKNQQKICKRNNSIKSGAN